ncbi:Protein of unknown function [Bacillus cereus]|nr:Protein of unknown function [Bacillus mobilis]SCV21709.1 Protein of unknown function [Bacillus cereus]
MMTMTTIT